MHLGFPDAEILYWSLPELQLQDVLPAFGAVPARKDRQHQGFQLESSAKDLLILFLAETNQDITPYLPGRCSEVSAGAHHGFQNLIPIIGFWIPVDGLFAFRNVN